MSFKKVEYGIGAEISRRLKEKGIEVHANSVNNFLKGKHGSRYASEILAAKRKIKSEQLVEAKEWLDTVKAKVQTLQLETQ